MQEDEPANSVKEIRKKKIKFNIVYGREKEKEKEKRSYTRMSENEEMICPHCQKDKSHMIPRSFTVHKARCKASKIECEYCKKELKAEVMKKHLMFNCPKNPTSEKNKKPN